MQELLDKWNIKIDYKVLLSMWNEPHRHYHSQNHLIDLIEQVNESKSFLNSQKDYEKLIICSLFHDCIYDTSNSDNEQKSADFFLSCCQEKNQDIKHIYQMIIDTKEHKSDDTLSKMFNHFDMNIVERDFEQLLEWEMGIREEYKASGDVYKTSRLLFLENILDKYPNNTENLLNLIEWVKNN